MSTIPRRKVATAETIIKIMYNSIHQSFHLSIYWCHFVLTIRRLQNMFVNLLCAVLPKDKLTIPYSLHLSCCAPIKLCNLLSGSPGSLNSLVPVMPHKASLLVHCDSLGGPCTDPALYTVYPKKYAHGFVVLCFVVVMQSLIMNSHEVFIHIHQGCFAGTGAIVRLPQCQWSKPDGYGKISQCITTTKHSKAKTVCIFLGIYCIYIVKA